MVAIHAAFLWSARGRIQKGDPDFTAFYTAGKILREGRGAELYRAATQNAVQWEFATDTDIRQGPLPYICPPFEALVFVPLTFLPYPEAFVLWNLLNLGLLFVIALLLRQSLDPLRPIPLWELVLAQLAFFPVFTNFLQGQDGILLLLVFILGFRALDRNAGFRAGCWFGLGVFKYHFVVPLVLILALWKGRKLVWGFAATASAATLLSLGIVGWHGALQYPAYAWHIVSLRGHGQTPVGLMTNLVGLLTGWSFLGNAAGPLRWLAIAASAVLLIAVACMRRAAVVPRNRASFRLSFAIAVITTVLVPYLTNTHDLCLLVLPLALLADHCAAHWSERQAVRSLLIPVVPLLISPLWVFFWMRWGKLNLAVIPLLWWVYAMWRELARLKENEISAGVRVTASA
ncbi:MAG: glycosyltransferase family 87 protein [Candidatus Sulfotelmatobacter sp.]|jgi:hypothetical protein